MSIIIDGPQEEIIPTNDEFEVAARANPHLYKFKTLVLNADYKPQFPLQKSIIPWTKTMFWLVKGWDRERRGGKPIINIVREYDDVVVRTSNRVIKLPSVAAMTKLVPMPSSVPFTRWNVYLRDNFTCQYTGEKLKPEDLTFDHVIPQSRGGKTTWDNIVTAASWVNEAKSNKSLKEFQKETGLHLLKQPYEPTVYEIREKSKRYPPKFLHESWMDFLYWDSPLER